MIEFAEPLCLAPTFAARIWGRSDLSPWYPMTGLVEKIGEAWLTGPQSRVETGELTGKTLGEIAPAFTGGGEFPLLVKMLFPNDKLSVQVHPDDAQAKFLGLQRGKTECWYVLEAEPGATVACGLAEGADAAAVRKAIEAGTLEGLLKMLPVKVGDMIFVDAGTVHAIGPGVTLLEVQQTCDVTYRLYDYGRPRELHLEAGLAVMKTKTRAGLIEPRRMNGFTRLIETEYFIADRYDLDAGFDASIQNDGSGCLVGLYGAGTANGLKLQPAQAVLLPKGACRVQSETPLTFLHCWEPAA